MKVKRLIQILELMDPEEELYVRDDVDGLVSVEDVEQIDALIWENDQFVAQKVWQICP